MQSPALAWSTPAPSITIRVVDDANQPASGSVASVIRRLMLPLVMVSLLTVGCSLPNGMPRIPLPGGPAPSAPIPPEAANQPTPVGEVLDGNFPKPHRKFAGHFGRSRDRGADPGSTAKLVTKA